jgi:hypothetical protein
MANIYENAVLALGVTAFVSDSKGLFSASSSNHDPEFVVLARQQLDHKLYQQLYSNVGVYFRSDTFQLGFSTSLPRNSSRYIK